ncbi:BolA family protein [Ferrovibrio sp.]|uniref:BolA family protein n=1 Tax=Ferrovibrio sp. TaxID=1917215 RepID=UPI0025C114D0|nr:BolA family protein [Ferrovibrio sp.]MBX3455620.1 BolA family transcriptional regulator [Ferrovibrio sp.]
MSIADTIRAKLTQALVPELLEIEDQSSHHAGHAGAKGLPAGETHFAVAVVSAKFGGLNRVARQRLVYGILAEELRHPVHALALTTLTPEEAAKR